MKLKHFVKQHKRKERRIRTKHMCVMVSRAIAEEIRYVMSKEGFARRLLIPTELK